MKKTPQIFLSHASEDREHSESTPTFRQTPAGIAIATPENLKDLLSMSNPPTRVWWEKVQMEFCLVPAGEFLMGSADSDEEALDSEKPQHKVYLDTYYIGRYPVTNAQYALFLNQSGHRPSLKWNNKQIMKDHPVVYVSWEDADAYCRWAGLRLPTEAEWEKAARGDDGRIYPWGNEWDAQKCNTYEGGKRGATSVGVYSPAGDSPYGCADMAGNVWEWTADWYDKGYYRVSPARNPKGADSGRYRVLRGGSWTITQRYARVSFRSLNVPVVFTDNVGFRVVVSPI